MSQNISSETISVNNSNSNTLDYEYFHAAFAGQSGVYSATVKNIFEFSSYLGLFGNLLMVIIFSRRPRIQPPDYFLINLAVIDLLYASGLIINLLLEVFAAKYHYQNLTLTCISLNLYNYFLIVPTLYTLAMITMERIVLVINIRIYRKMVTKKNIISTFLFIYTISACAIVPNTLTHCLYDIQPLAITYLFQGHILLLAMIVSTLMITLCIIYCRILDYGENNQANQGAGESKDGNSTFTNMTERTGAAGTLAATNGSKAPLGLPRSRRSVWFLIASRRHNGMPHDMTNLSVVNNMHGRVVISPLRPDVIQRQARLNNSMHSSGNSSCSAATQPLASQMRVANDTTAPNSLRGGGSQNNVHENARINNEVAVRTAPPNSPRTSENSQNSVSNDKKTFYLLTAISGLFIVLYWPNIIATALYNLQIAHITGTENHLWFFLIVNRMSLLHTLVNPLTSLVISSRFRSEIKYLFTSNFHFCNRSMASSSA